MSMIYDREKYAMLLRKRSKEDNIKDKRLKVINNETEEYLPLSENINSFNSITTSVILVLL